MKAHELARRLLDEFEPEAEVVVFDDNTGVNLVIMDVGRTGVLPEAALPSDYPDGTAAIYT